MSRENIDKIAVQLRAKYKDKPQTAIRAVATDIVYSGAVDAVLASDDIVDKLFAKLEAKERATEAKVSAESPDVCPLCSVATTPIKLTGERSAKWCQQHFVVFPTRPKE